MPRLLELDGTAGLFELALELLGLFLLEAFLDRLWRLVDERLGLPQPEAGSRADALDDLDLLVAEAGQDHVERARALVLGSRAVTAAAGSRSRRGHGRGRHAELLLERLDPLGQLEHRDALELVDPFLCAGHLGLLCFSRI